MTTTKNTPVTVLGLGRMGAALAGAFVAAGHPTTVWNRSQGKADRLVEAGAVAAATVAEAVAASPLVVACVTTYGGVHEIVGHAGGALHGRVLVTLNTGTPKDATATAELAARHGAIHLDGAIMNVPQTIGRPDTLLLYSGSEAAFKDHRETLAVLGGDTRYLGADAGTAKLYEMAIGGTLLPAMVAFLHGAALLRHAGARAADLVPYAVQWLGMVQGTLPGLAEHVDSGHYETDIAALDVFREGAAHEVEVAEQVGLRTDWLVPLLTLLEDAAEAGHGEHSVASVVEVLTRRQRD